MPPRKKAKAAPSTPVADDDAMAIDTPTPKGAASKQLKEPPYDILKDPWTDEQETSLFKGLMKWKPNGMHKHFRMLALSEYLRNHGYDPQVETHTRIPGIWQKLKTIYSMPIIDDRENSFEYDEEFVGKYHEFELPPNDYATETFLRGKLDSEEEEGSSPRHGRSVSPVQPTRKRKRGDTVTQVRTRASTVDDTDDTKTSPVQSPPAKITRSGRSSRRAAAEASSSRPPSRETTIEEDADDAEEEVEEEVEEEDQETEEDGSSSPKTSRETRSKAEIPATRKSRRKR